MLALKVIWKCLEYLLVLMCKFGNSKLFRRKLVSLTYHTPASTKMGEAYYFMSQSVCPLILNLVVLWDILTQVLSKLPPQGPSIASQLFYKLKISKCIIIIGDGLIPKFQPTLILEFLCQPILILEFPNYL